MAGIVDRIVGVESGGNPYARNSRSSAAGLGQFTDATWLDMLRRHRPDLVQGTSPEQLLSLKMDPTLSREMTGAYAGDNSAFLQSRGIEPTPGNQYLAHFAGPGGAAAIYADPGKTVEALLGPRAVAANPFLAGKTGQDVIAWADAKMNPRQKMMANILRKRAGNAPPSASPQPAAAPPAAAGIDRLKAALGGRAYDAAALARADQFLAGGANTAKGAKNWLDVINSALQTGLGTYEKYYGEGKKKKEFDENLRQGLGTAEDTAAIAQLLMASPDPQQQELGIGLLAKVEAAKRAYPELYGTTPQYYPDPATGELQFGVVSNRGNFKPVQLPGGKALPPTYSVDTGTGTQVTTRAGGVPVSTVPKDIVGKERLEEVGKGQGQAQVDLPRVQSNSDSMLSQIEAVRSDPYLPSMTGPLDTYRPNLSGDAARVQSKVDQLGGQAFLQAFQSLKGGGQITEMEGQKATAALSRLQNMGVNDADYTAALDDFKNEVIRLRDLAQLRAGGGAPAASPEAAPPPSATGGYKVLKVH